MQQFDQVVAIFNPLRLDDLKPSVRACIGEVGVWHAAWLTGEDESNAPGQWAMSPERWYGQWEQRRLRGDFCWAPLSELAILEVFDERLTAFDAARRVRHWRKQLAHEIRLVKLRAIASGV